MLLKERTKCELPPEPSDRSKGLHLSEIIGDIATSSGIDSFVKDNSPDFKPNLRMEMGFIWERALEAEFKRRAMTHCTSPVIVRPGEVVVDGIAMSPDGVVVDPWQLVEYKLTWMSSNRDPQDNWRWMTQVKSYLHAVKASQCGLHVLYVNGDYRNSGPEYWLYLLDFSPTEICENWKMIVRHAKNRGWIT